MVYFEMVLKWFLVYFTHTKIKTLPIGYWFSQWELVLFVWLRRVGRENSATISLSGRTRFESWQGNEF